MWFARFRIQISFAGSLLLFSPFGFSTQVVVQNPSFATPALPQFPDPNSFTKDGKIPGWCLQSTNQVCPAGAAGVFNPGKGQYPLGVPDSDPNVGYVNDGYMYQILSTAVTAGKNYTLTVSVGNRQDVPAFVPASYFIAFGAGDSPDTSKLLAKATGGVQLPQPGLGQFISVSTSYFVPEGDPNIGKNLQVFLGASGVSQANFDRVFIDDSGARDGLNVFVPKPGFAAMSGPTMLGQIQPADIAGEKFTMVFKGDVRSSIDLTATGNDPLVNAFAYVNQRFFGGSGTSSATAALNSDGNTVVTFTGSHPVLNSQSFDYGVATNDLPHFGIDGAPGSCSTPGCLTLKGISQFWTTASVDTVLPDLTVGGPLLTGNNLKYAIVFAQVTKGGNTVGQWFEVPFTTATGPVLTFENNTDGAETLSNVGFFYSDFYIPLDQLNWPLQPPPDQPGTNFTAWTVYDGLTLGAGESVTTPEPAALTITTLGLLLGLLAKYTIYGKRRVAE